MVSVCAFLRAKTTDEADNPRSNLNKDNFALHGSFVRYQHGLSLCNYNARCLCSSAFLSAEVVWVRYSMWLCSSSFCSEEIQHLYWRLYIYFRQTYLLFLSNWNVSVQHCLLQHCVSIQLKRLRNYISRGIKFLPDSGCFLNTVVKK